MDFEVFWDIARKWRGHSPNPKKLALKAWQSAVHRADPEAIVKGALGYKQYLMDYQKFATEYACMASTWLNQDRWEQYEDYVKTAEQLEAERAAREEHLRKIVRMRAGA